MPTHAELASRLLSDAAGFFRTLGSQNTDLKPQMEENAGVFEQMANLIIDDPTGEINGTSYGDLCGRLLQDAAGFFQTLAEQNEPIREQMEENANVFQQIGQLVSQDPNGVLE